MGRAGRGEIEDCVAIIGHRRDAGISEGWEIERLHAQHLGDAAKAQDAETITRYGGWIYMFGFHFGSLLLHRLINDALKKNVK